MAEGPSAEKTEPATPRRREQARERGDVAQSRDAGSVLALAMAFALIFSSTGAAIGLALAEGARAAWSGALVHPRTLPDFHALLLHEGLRGGAALAPFVAALAALGIAGSLVQTGPLWASKALEVRLDRMNPLSGLRRLVSPEKLVELAKAAVKAGLVLTVAWTTLAPAVPGMQALVAADPAIVPAVLADLARRVAWPLLAVLALLAVLDVAWVRFRLEKRLRMSRQEVRDEHKDREGDPNLRARIRQTQRELSRQRLIAEVSKADVVVRNPTHFAVALSYQRDAMSAPRVVAKGRGFVALRILEIAREHEVPIVEDPPLARLLHRTVPVGREIPMHLYRAIAELLAYVYRLDRRRGGAWGVAS